MSRRTNEKARIQRAKDYSDANIYRLHMVAVAAESETDHADQIAKWEYSIKVAGAVETSSHANGPGRLTMTGRFDDSEKFKRAVQAIKDSGIELDVEEVGHDAYVRSKPQLKFGEWETAKNMLNLKEPRKYILVSPGGEVVEVTGVFALMRGAVQHIPVITTEGQCKTINPLCVVLTRDLQPSELAALNAADGVCAMVEVYEPRRKEARLAVKELRWLEDHLDWGYGKAAGLYWKARGVKYPEMPERT
jgi:hypothetical protein